MWEDYIGFISFIVEIDVLEVNGIVKRGLYVCMDFVIVVFSF